MKTIALFVNFKRQDTIGVVEEIKKWLAQQGNYNLLMEEKAASLLNQPQLAASDEQLRNEAELVISLGGDGTLLHAARVMREGPLPILGVNFGSLGFLTEITEEELYSSINDMLCGNFEFEKRMVLSAVIIRNGSCSSKIKALNDIVVNNGSLAKLINLRILVEDEYLTTYISDGLIIATPTGSTGYSLSVGGPIVCPEMNLILLSPISPHTLSARPMILPPESTIKVIVESNYSGMMLTADGQEQFEIKNNDKIEIKWEGDTIHLIKSKKKTFFEVLRNKLKWGGYLS